MQGSPERNSSWVELGIAGVISSWSAFVKHLQSDKKNVEGKCFVSLK